MALNRMTKAEMARYLLGDAIIRYHQAIGTGLNGDVIIDQLDRFYSEMQIGYLLDDFISDEHAMFIKNVTSLNLFNGMPSRNDTLISNEMPDDNIPF